jgi:all-trans-retinol dehydrogenase (NAD+)
MYRRGFGHVVNVSSAAGLVGVPGLSAYCASKWGVFGLTESLRHESHIRSGGQVKFSSVHPMFLRTGMFEGASLKGLGSIIFPCVANHDVIAKAIVEGALKRGRRVVKRPRSLRLVLLLRGLLPDAIFNGMSRILNVHTSMNRYKGASQ